MKKITCKQALTSSGWLNNVAVSINDSGKIAEIKSNESLSSFDVDVLLPAQSNLHSHSFQRAMSGLTEMRGENANDSFWTWRKLMYDFLDKITPDQIETIASFVFMEMLEAGYSAVAEFHYIHHAMQAKQYDNIAELSDRIIAGAQRAGIGLTLLPVLYQYGGCDLRPLLGGQLRFHNDQDSFAKLHAAATKSIASAHSDYHIGVAPHSLRAASEDDLRFITELGKAGPIHMHLAEQIPEVKEVLEFKGARPTEWLLDNHNVDERWCLIHVTQMNADETKRLAQSKAIAGLCPITESNLGDGIFNGVDYLADQGRFGLGSDSNVHIALFDELKTLDYSQRLRDNSRAALATKEQSTGRVIFETSAKGGAQAGGRKSGTIAVGQLADLIGIETDNAWICNRKDDFVLDSLIFGGHGQRCITDVWSAGRHMVKDSCHHERDAISRDYQNVCETLGYQI